MSELTPFGVVLAIFAEKSRMRARAGVREILIVSQPKKIHGQPKSVKSVAKELAELKILSLATNNTVTITENVIFYISLQPKMCLFQFFFVILQPIQEGLQEKNLACTCLSKWARLPSSQI